MRRADWLRDLTCCAALALATGCPEGRRAPAPTDARACETLADCNCDAECGALDACVEGYCETGQSLLVPCLGDALQRAADCE